MAAEKNRMLDKLEAIERRFEEVKDELTKPEILSDMKLMTKLSQEFKELESIVRTTHRYRNILDNIANSKEILDHENDAE